MTPAPTVKDQQLSSSSSDDGYCCRDEDDEEEGGGGGIEQQQEPLLLSSSAAASSSCSCTPPDSNDNGVDTYEETATPYDCCWCCREQQRQRKQRATAQPQSSSSSSLFRRYRKLFLGLACCDFFASVLLLTVPAFRSNAVDLFLLGRLNDSDSDGGGNKGGTDVEPKPDVVAATSTAVDPPPSPAGAKTTKKKKRSRGSSNKQKKSKLFPLLLDSYRRGEVLNVTVEKRKKKKRNERETRPPPLPGPDDQCSCHGTNSNSTSSNNKKCCVRYLHVMHKMGFVMTQGGNMPEVAPYYKDKSIIRSAPDLNRHRHIDLLDFSGAKDYRDVFIFRNIYDAIVSGYVYHKSGRECWLKDNGKKNKFDVFPRYWISQLSFTPSPSYCGRSLCKYLAEESLLAGMHVYIDYVFRYWYRDPLARWAVSQQYQPEGSLRARVVCFEDVMSHREATIQGVVDFLFSHQGGNKEPTLKQSSKGSSSTYHGGHTTAQSHDPLLHDELVRIIQQVDETYYNGDIAWLNQIWPC